MKTKEDFVKIYTTLLGSGVVKSQTELAKVLNVSRTSIANAIAGRNGYATDKMYDRILTYATSHGISINQNGNSGVINQPICTGGEQKNFAKNQDDKFIELSEKFLEELKAERESHERIVMAILDGKK